MANTGSAAKAIQLELQQARQGMRYYTKLVEDLEDVLATLSAIDTPGTGARARRSNAKSGQKVAPSSKNNRQKAAVKTSGRTTLPSTGKDFWPSLLSHTPQSASEIYKAAVAALKIRPSEEDKKKLNQRLSNALSVLSKSGDINAEGSGRNRVYTRKTPAAS